MESDQVPPMGFFNAYRKVKMKQVTEFINNLLDGSIKQDEINAFIEKLKNNELNSELDEIKAMIEAQLSYLHPL